MKTNTVSMSFAALCLTILISGCGSSSSTSETNLAFYDVTFNDERTSVVVDNVTKLTFINDASACFDGIVEHDSTNCDTLDYAGVSDWRYPTSSELSGLIKSAVKLGDTLEYAVPNCLVSTASDGYVYTENSSDAGKIFTETPGNAGLRCVHDGVLEF